MCTQKKELNAFAEATEKGLTVGMNIQLLKPIDIEKVVSTIAEYRTKTAKLKENIP